MTLNDSDILVQDNVTPFFFFFYLSTSFPVRPFRDAVVAAASLAFGGGGGGGGQEKLEDEAAFFDQSGRL